MRIDKVFYIEYNSTIHFPQIYKEVTMKTKTKPWLKRLMAITAAILISVSMFPALTYADDPLPTADSEYDVEVSLSDPSTDIVVGDTVTMTATVTCDGEEITDLEAAGLQLWFYADLWDNGHSTADGYSDNCTIAYSGTGDGTDFSADITFHAESKYFIKAQLKKSETEVFATGIDFTVSAVPDISDPAQEPTEPVELKNGDFELGTEGWTLVPDTLEIADTDAWMTNNQTQYLDLYTSANAETDLTVSYQITDLPAGSYLAKVDLEGQEDSESYLSLNVTDTAGNSLLATPAALTTTGYNNWETFRTEVFTLTEPTTINVVVSGTTPAGFWGALDNLVVLGPETEEDTSVTGNIEVEKVKHLSDDFIMGADISTIVSEYESGVTYQDFDGNTLENVTDFCQFLADCGINCVRVRVWNDPYDEDGHGYGAGNCNVETAKKIADACAKANIGMMIDFHYSDFWADPGRQLAPKAWTNYTIEKKAAAIYDFTLESLTEIASTGANIRMVQVGNETNNAICGESGTENMCKLFSAGSSAVRKFAEKTYNDSKAVKVIIHFANPEKGTMTSWAANLAAQNVDYDVLGTSYYVFWHGTLDNLKSQMRKVQNTYGKDVMVVETSYIYTSQDTDGKTNGISTPVDNYAVSPQGQASVVRDIIDAVNSVGGLGVCYWEPAWITVGDITGLEGAELADQLEKNSEIWETYGSGWASSHAIGYDPNVNETTYGGSEWDNQALFDAEGKPLDSLHVWNYVKTGSITKDLYVSNVAATELEFEKGDEIILPETVNVTYNRPSVGTIAEKVTWDPDELAAVDTNTPGIYTVHGTVSLSQACTTGEQQPEAVCTITILEQNLITDPDAAGFETDTDFTVSGNGLTVASTEDPLEGELTLHWWSETATQSSVTYDVPISLDAGYYTFEAVAMGIASDSVSVSILDTNGNVLFAGDPVFLANYSTDPDNYLKPFVNFRLSETTEVKLCITINISDGGWGSADGMYLHKHENIRIDSMDNEIHSLTCADCGTILVNGCTGTLEITDTLEPTTTEDGYQIYVCPMCGGTYQVTLPATGSSEQPDTPDDTDIPANPDNTETPTESNPSDTSGSSGQNSQGQTASGAKTSDPAPIMACSIAIIGALTVIVLSVKQRKHP